MAMGFASRLFELILCMKDCAFEREDEWRFVIFKPKGTELDTQREVEFREKNGEVIPYLCASFYDEYDENKKMKQKSRMFPLNSIRIGPGLDFKRAKHSLGLLTKKHSSISTDIKVNNNIKIDDAGYDLRG